MACVYLERRQILRLPLALGLPCLPFPLENDTKMEPVATSGPTMRGSGEKEIRGAGGREAGNGEGRSKQSYFDILRPYCVACVPSAAERERERVENLYLFPALRQGKFFGHCYHPHPRLTSKLQGRREGGGF